MNIIKELTEKYNGRYSEEVNKSVSSPLGKYTFQPQKGVIEIDGSKISINIKEVGGASPVSDPFRIALHLDKTYETKLTIFPKGFWNNLMDFILPKRGAFIPKQIRKQFWFGGNEDLIKKLVADKIFTENLIHERIYVESGDSPTSRIILTPGYGIKDIEQFEKFVTVLKRIESHIKSPLNNGEN